MRILLRSTALVVLALGIASQASAGDKVWSVPGVINNGLATVISCSNGGSVAATVTVDIFTQNGGGDVTGTTSIPAGGNRISSPIR